MGYILRKQYLSNTELGIKKNKHLQYHIEGTFRLNESKLKSRTYRVNCAQKFITRNQYMFINGLDVLKNGKDNMGWNFQLL